MSDSRAEPTEPPSGGWSIAEPAPRARSQWVDAAKGIAISLVVFGHCLGGLNSRHLLAHEAVWSGVYDWIYTFHMPAFFLLSGLFAFRSADKGLGRFLDGKVRRITYPYFLWTLLTWLPHHWLGSAASKPSTVHDLLISVYEPFMKFWFLYTLFVLFLLAAAVARLPARRWAFLALAAALYAAHAWGMLTFWSVADCVGAFGIYFAAGAALGSPFVDAVAKLKPAAAIGLSIAGFAALTALFAATGGAHGLWAPAAATLGMGAVFGLAQCISASPGQNHAAVLGTYSMEIYLVHSLAAVAVRVILLRHCPAEALLALMVVAGIYGSMALAAMARKWHLPYLFEWPSHRNRRPAVSAAP